MMNAQRHDIVHQVVFFCNRGEYFGYAMLLFRGRYFFETEVGGGFILHGANLTTWRRIRHLKVTAQPSSASADRFVGPRRKARSAYPGSRAALSISIEPTATRFRYVGPLLAQE
jgi:hypothetical protein